MSAFFFELGRFSLFFREIWHTLLNTKHNLRPIIAQTSEVTIRSLSTVVFSGFFVGGILVVQFNAVLAQYDAQIFLGGLNTSALIREVGPLIISFLLAGKVGAFTAAELGTMRVTEQIDAIECLGTNPIQYLILPRFFGIVLASMILLSTGLLVSVIGSMGFATALCGLNPLQFAQSIPRFTDITTLLSGFLRAAIYGVIVAGVCCYQGYTATGGAKGVGRAVTRAAIYTNLYIVIANYITGLWIHLLLGESS